MKIKEITDTASFYLGIDENDAEARAALLRCANLVINEIACDYFPLRKETAVNSADGYVALSSVYSGRIFEVISVETSGRRVKFKRYPSYIKAEAGGVLKIVFSYLPEGARGENEDANLPEKFTPRVIAYGAAAEYCLLSGMFEEAVIWEKRYKDALAAALRDRKEIRVPAREWI